MSFFHRLICLISVAMAFSFLSALGQNAISSNLLEKARAASVLAGTSATDAGVMRDLAINAVRNALAVQNDSAEAFLLVLKSGDRSKQVSVKKSYIAVTESVSEAVANLERIVEYAGDAAESAASAHQLEQVAVAARTPRDSESAIKKAERAAESAGKSARKAAVIAEVLKKTWLLPVPQVRAASTAGVDSTVQPPPAR